MKKLFTVILFFCSLHILAQTNSRGGEAENTSASSGKTHVILVGISSYKNLPDGQQLDFADDDAILFQEYLKSWGDINVKLFLNEEATNKDKIGREIQNTLLNEAQSGDDVIIYFAGHGDVDTLVEDGFLLLNQVEPPSVSNYSFNDAISLSLIQRYVNVAADKRNVSVTFIADACHSGSVRQINANKMISEISNNAVTITSCQHDEVSKESIEWGNGHGVFTYYLVQGLMGLADMDGDKKIDLMELEMYTKMNVSKKTEKTQTPVFMGKSQKEFAAVNDDLLQLAKKSDNMTFQELAALEKTKSLSDPLKNVSGPCKELLQLLQEQTTANKFFEDELDSLDRLPFVIGAVQAKKTHSKTVSDVAVSSNGNFTASSSVDGIALYKGQDVKSPVWLKGHASGVNSVEFSPSKDQLLSGGADSQVILWDVNKEMKISSLSISSPVSALKFVSDAQVAIGTEKGSLIIWDLVLNSMKEYKLHKGTLTDIELSGNLVLTSGIDGKINTFDIITRKKSLPFNGSSMAIYSLAVVSSSDELLSAGEDGKLMRWEIDSRRLVKEIPLDLGPLTALSIDPLEKYCFIGSKQKKAGVFDLSANQMNKSRLASISGANSLVYDPVFNNLKIGEVDGSISVQQVKIKPENSSAIQLYEQLGECDDLKKMQYKIDGTLIIGLNNQVNEVLNALVNGEANQPGLSDLQQAKRYAEKALEVGKDYEVDADKLEINLRLIEVYEILLTDNKDQFKSALEKVRRIEELDPKGAYVFNVSALLYAKLNDAQKAKEMATKAEKLAPQWAEASINTGKVLSMTGDKKAAEQKFQETIKKAPDQSKGYTALGELYLEQGKLEDARKNLEKALKLDSGANTPLKLYQETMGKIEMLNSRGGTGAKGPIPLNAAFYRNYTNKLKLSASDYTTYKITATNASLTKNGNEYTLRVSGPVKSVFITLTSITTGKVMGQYEIPVKDLPQTDLWWGTARGGDRMDVDAEQFIYGYNPEFDPDLENNMFHIESYIVEFQQSKLRFTGQGPTIYSQLLNEVKRCRKAGEKGGVCVAAMVVNKFGDRFTIQSCYSF
jgi:WD40 repeat protein/Flp pilus assembly protein TadD